ncbi:Scr1 family TA system antitoxin-like transcriptional regulator [Nocardiopsis lambiniae]|uniref:Scr1 family TA system antitoxin-like transcriptional regulator n=1 Tax=Nocardiopsis lambiniae TaxID=3075539 RepID=A0ABU2MBH5_9ACTN|nr:Scr1 family TA system antitoxin-like transcriptional regulator [Nocardiopsis sp. DSM 44743]MDT0329962.1 Scr1 family TA system antitoxin-like transcriptional regulator [Nocardiopsis sp. DSM 44743]
MEPPDFASELRKRRMEAGLSQQQLAARTGLSVSSISRWETNGSLPKRPSVEILDRALPGEGPLLARFEEAKDGVALPPWSRSLSVVEPEARAAEVVSPAHVPGYLQSRTYATALFRAARPWGTGEEIARLVDLRCQRLEQLPELRLTTAFPVFALEALPEEVRKEQAAHLLRWSETGRVTVHMVTSALLVPGAPVMVFHLPGEEQVISCDYASGNVLAERSTHRRLLSMVATAFRSALPVEQSLAVLEGLA